MVASIVDSYSMESDMARALFITSMVDFIKENGRRIR
jgi:hypothetical protein